MASIDPTQIAVGAAILAGVYFVYKRGQNDPYTKDYNAMDDLDPNWKGGKITEAPTAPLNLHTSKRPNCQKFDTVSYLYLDANMPDGDANEGACFAKGGERYVNALGAISFPGDLTEVTSAMAGQNTTQGTCYFANSLNNGYLVKPAQAIVNGSARLCFGGDGHHFTRRSDNLTYYNPQLSFVTTPPTGNNYCETLDTIDGNVRWTHNYLSAPYDGNPSACAAANSGSTKFRYRDDAAQRFVYQNPYNGELVQDPFH